MDHHLEYYTKEKNLKKALKDQRIYQLRENEYRLTIDEKHRILLNNIYGIGKDDLKGHVEFSEALSDVFNPAAMAGWYSYIKDQVGTVNQVYSHQSQAVVDTRTYDVFGELVYQSGSSSGNMGFQSKYFDAETGLNYFYYRYYNPRSGRLNSEDPLRFIAGSNFYSFIENDPVNSSDLYGLINDEPCTRIDRTKLFSRRRTERQKPEKGDWSLIHESTLDTPVNTPNPVAALAASVHILRCLYEREILLITRKYVKYKYLDIYFCKAICAVWLKI
jgi:RHS repeat-associated protein